MTTVPRRIEIPRFPQNKRLAVTTSFDDGVIQDRRVIELFNQWGITGTFNLNSGLLGGPRCVEKAEVAGLYRGHEVAIHTVTHPFLDRLDPMQVAREVLDDRQALEDLVGYPVRGMAYPFGTYNRRVIETLRGLGIVYSRTCENANECFPPVEPLAWKSTAHQFVTQPGTVPEQFAKWHGNEWASGVFFIWGHTYEFDNDWTAVERLFKPLAGKPDVWYCTNIELFDYEAARQRVVIAANRASARNLSGVTVTLRVDDRLVDLAPGQLVSFV